MAPMVSPGELLVAAGDHEIDVAADAAGDAG